MLWYHAKVGWRFGSRRPWSAYVVRRDAHLESVPTKVGTYQERGPGAGR